MRSLLYCLVSYLFTLCHVAQADSSNVKIDLLRYDLIDEGLTALVRGDSRLVQEVFIPNKVKHEGETYTVTAVANAAFYDYMVTSVRLPTTLKAIG